MWFLKLLGECRAFRKSKWFRNLIISSQYDKMINYTIASHSHYLLGEELLNEIDEYNIINLEFVMKDKVIIYIHEEKILLESNKLTKNLI